MYDTKSQLRENPCPKCGGARNSLEAACSHCGWRPDSARVVKAPAAQNADLGNATSISSYELLAVVVWTIGFALLSAGWLARFAGHNAFVSGLGLSMPCALLGGLVYAVYLYLATLGPSKSPRDMALGCALSLLLSNPIIYRGGDRRIVHVIFWNILFLSTIASATAWLRAP